MAIKPLFLVGYMGCGKSTIGRKLARRLGVVRADTDAMVEEQQGASVADIFQYEGEEQFRTMERMALERAIAMGDNLVVSTGGGLPMWGDNIARMNAVGHTVYLRRSPEQIASRLSPYGRRKRPRLRGLNDAELMEYMRDNMAAREPFYALAQVVIDCDGISDDEVLELILKEIEKL